MHGSKRGWRRNPAGLLARSGGCIRRTTGPRPFNVCPFPIGGPWRWAVSDGEQVAGLVGEFDDRGGGALFCRGLHLLILAQLHRKALSSVTSATRLATVGPKRSAISA